MNQLIDKSQFPFIRFIIHIQGEIAVSYFVIGVSDQLCVCLIETNNLTFQADDQAASRRIFQKQMIYRAKFVFVHCDLGYGISNHEGTF